MRTRVVILAICLWAVTTCPNMTMAQNSAPSVHEWVGIGPDGGNIQALAIDPKNPKTLYAGTPAGLFKSTDGAATWRSSNYGLPTPNIGYAPGSAVNSLAIDPQTPSTIYAGVRGISIDGCSGQCNIPVSGGIFKSTDSGATWNAINAGLETESFLGSLTIDPWNSTTVYAATSHAVSPLCVPGTSCHQPYGSSVFKTMDGGASWQPSSDGLPPADALSRSLAIDPQDPNTLYDATTKGVFKSTNGGVTWNAVMSGVTVCCQLVIDPIDHATVYVVGRGILKTTDGGESWYEVSGPSGPAVSSLAIDPNRALYATISYFGSAGGIFKSVDGGVSWLKASDENAGIGLVIDPSDSDTIYAATSKDGVLKTTDAGSSWAPTNFRFKQTDVLTLAADPQNLGVLYTSTRIGVFRTADQGINWSKADSGLPTKVPPATTSLAVDTQTPGTVYALFPSIRYVDGTDSGQVGGVFKSTDGGTTWNMLTSGLEGFNTWSLSALLIDPQNPNTIYLTNVMRPGTNCCLGTLKSTDGGVTWASAGLDNHVLMAIDPQTPTTLYATVGYNTGTFSKSTDGGATWSDARLPPETDVDGCDDFWIRLISVTVDPRDSNVVYATSSGGLFKSTDGGENWQTMNSGLSPFICTYYPYCGYGQYWVGSFIIDPQNSQTLYALTTGGILRSTDGGASWSAENKGLPPPPANDIRSIAIHPKDSTLYAATRDGVYAINFHQP